VTSINSALITVVEVVYEGDGVAGVGQQVVLNTDLQEVGDGEVLGRHLPPGLHLFESPAIVEKIK
jgi:hypothetical protein